MLTRLEVSGFKNLVDFSVDFGPFTCIAGPNGVGKSNVFDAIRFLSLLADNTIMEAASLVRGSDIDTSDIRDLFLANGSERDDSFKIAAEMIIEPKVHDDFGRPAEASSTYLRYEIEIGYEPATSRTPGRLGRLVLLAESLTYITEGEDATRLKFPNNAARFRRKVVMNRRRTQSGYISIRKAEDGQTEILVHADGGSRGPAQTAPAITAPRTIVATSNTSVTPTILAARREMQRWRFLALEPSAMRKPDRFQSQPFITANGGHIPAALNRLVAEAGEPADVYARIATRVAKLVPIIGLEVDVDDVRQILTLMVNEQGGSRLPVASLSDGTLRFLTLATLVADPLAERLICIEEPENGIHPAKIPDMVDLLRDLAVDSDSQPGPDNPFRQVIVATHSPVFVQLQHPDDLLLSVEARVRSSTGLPVRTLRCRPLQNTWRARHGEPAVGLGTILSYLSAPPGAQLELPGLEKLSA